MDFIRLNAALIVSDKVTEQAINSSKEIASNSKPVFTLDSIDFLPHITVYPPEYPNQELENVVSSVEKIANETEQMTATFSSPKNLDDFVVIPVRLSSNIRKLHERVVTTLNPLRNGHIKEGYEDNVAFSPEQHDNIQNYGYPHVMALYSPHLTIIRLDDKESASVAAQSLQWDISEYSVDKLAVYTVGENGTCKEMLGGFSLKPIPERF